MISKITVLMVLLLAIPCYSQVSLRAGMGINFQNTPSLNDYINLNSQEELADFNSAIIFSLEGGYPISSEFEIAAEAGYLITSHNFTVTGGTYEFFYSIIMPSVIGYYVLRGEGYQLKFGGGGGIRLVNAEEKFPGFPSADEFSSTGFGLLLRADGNTLLGGNFYANIGADLRYDLNGEPEPQNTSRELVNSATDERVNINSLGFGIHLGITYIF